MTNPLVLLAILPLVISRLSLKLLSVVFGLVVIASFSPPIWNLPIALLGMLLCLESHSEKGFTAFKALTLLFVSILVSLKQSPALPLAILAGLFPFHILGRDIFLRLKPALCASFGLVYFHGIFGPLSNQTDYSIWLLAGSIYLVLLSFAQKDVRSFMFYRLFATFGLAAGQLQSPWFFLVLWLIEFGIWLNTDASHGRFAGLKISKFGVYSLILCGLCYLPIWPIYDTFFENNPRDWFRMLLASLLGMGSIFVASRALATIQDKGKI